MTLEAIIFFVAAALALGGAVGVVLGRNPVHCALLLVVTLVAAVMAFLFVPLAVFVIDTGLVEADFAQLGETVQASAEDGASMIDQAAYVQSGGQRVVLDHVLHGAAGPAGDPCGRARARVLPLVDHLPDVSAGDRVPLVVERPHLLLDAGDDPARGRVHEALRRPGAAHRGHQAVDAAGAGLREPRLRLRLERVAQQPSAGRRGARVLVEEQVAVTVG